MAFQACCDGARHLFLTGEIGAGKSTLIRQVLEKHADWRIGGFRTVTREGDVPGAMGGVYLIAGRWPDGACGAANRIGVRREGRRFDAFPETFDRLGPVLLSETCDLRLMDELGRMEKDAEAFGRAVWSALTDGAPTLGVLKNCSTPLLDAVRARRDTQVWTVTHENRSALAPLLDAAVTRAVEYHQRGYSSYQ